MTWNTILEYCSTVEISQTSLDYTNLEADQFWLGSPSELYSTIYFCDDTACTVQHIDAFLCSNLYCTSWLCRRTALPSISNQMPCINAVRSSYNIECRYILWLHHPSPFKYSLLETTPSFPRFIIYGRAPKQCFFVLTMILTHYHNNIGACYLQYSAVQPVLYWVQYSTLAHAICRFLQYHSIHFGISVESPVLQTHGLLRQQHLGLQVLSCQFGLGQLSHFRNRPVQLWSRSWRSAFWSAVLYSNVF